MKDSEQLKWAPVTNKSSQRWHGFREGKAICGVPWCPMENLYSPNFPGKHVACAKCLKLSDQESEARFRAEHPFFAGVFNGIQCFSTSAADRLATVKRCSIAQLELILSIDGKNFLKEQRLPIQKSVEKAAQSRLRRLKKERSNSPAAGGDSNAA